MDEDESESDCDARVTLAQELIAREPTWAELWVENLESMDQRKADVLRAATRPLHAKLVIMDDYMRENIVPVACFHEAAHRTPAMRAAEARINNIRALSTAEWAATKNANFDTWHRQHGAQVATDFDACDIYPEDGEETDEQASYTWCQWLASLHVFRVGGPAYSRVRALTSDAALAYPPADAVAYLAPSPCKPRAKAPVRYRAPAGAGHHGLHRADSKMEAKRRRRAKERNRSRGSQAFKKERGARAAKESSSSESDEIFPTHAQIRRRKQKEKKREETFSKQKQKKREEMARELARAEGGEQSLVGSVQVNFLNDGQGEQSLVGLAGGPASPAPRQLFGPGGSPLFEY